MPAGVCFSVCWAHARRLALQPVLHNDSLRSSRTMHYEKTMLAPKPYLVFVCQVFHDDSLPSSLPSPAPGRSVTP